MPRTHFPQPHQNERALRGQFHSMAPAAFQFEDGRRGLGKLRAISLTGGLLRLSKPLLPGALIEVVFMFNGSPIQGIAELLTPASATLKCQQPFKFIMIDDDYYQRLRSLIRSLRSQPNCSE